MSEHRRFDRIIALLTLGISIFAAYYAYRSYIQDHSKYAQELEEPNLTVRFYRSEDENEYYESEAKVEPDKVRRDGEYMEYDLPLRLSNIGIKDGNKVTVWIGVENVEDVSVQTSNASCGWKISERRGKRWVTKEYDLVSPSAGVYIRCLKLRAKYGTKEVKLFWSVLASQMRPKTGSLVLKL